MKCKIGKESDEVIQNDQKGKKRIEGKGKKQRKRRKTDK